MNQLKLTTKSEIIAWLDTMEITQYHINKDLSVDVESSVDLGFKNLTHFPIQFNEVFGAFSCTHNQLTSLEGAPRKVYGNFYCDENLLTSLEFAPDTNESFDCSSNKLKTLKGISPNIKEDFHCHDNELESLEYCPQLLEYLNCNNNQLKTLKHTPFKITRHFDCEYNQITSLEELDNLKVPSLNLNHNPLNLLLVKESQNVEIEKLFLPSQCKLQLNHKPFRDNSSHGENYIVVNFLELQEELRIKNEKCWLDSTLSSNNIKNKVKL